MHDFYYKLKIILRLQLSKQHFAQMLSSWDGLSISGMFTEH